MAEHQSIDGSYTLVRYRMIQNLLFSVMRKTPKFASKPKELLRIFAKKCQSRREMDRDSLKELWNVIERNGGFPMLDSTWNETKFDLSEMLSKYIQLNRQRLGFLSVEPYTIRNGPLVTNRLFISAGPHWEYKERISLKGYRIGVAHVVNRLLKLQNETFNQSKFDVEYDKLVELDQKFTELADFRRDSDEAKNMTIIRPLEDLIRAVPEVDWIRVLRGMPRGGTSEEQTKKMLARTDVHGHRYFFGSNRELARLATRTPRTVLANYLVVRQLADVALFFHDQDHPHARFWGNDNNAQFCADQFLTFFPMISMNVLMEAVEFKRENFEIAAEMVEEVRREYVRTFEHSRYLSEHVKRAAIRKLKAIRVNLGYQEYLEGAKGAALERLYETIVFLETDSPIQIYLKMWRHRTEQLVEHILHDTTLNPVHSKIFQSTAHYNTFHNSLTLVMPYLTYPHLDPQFPAALNFGSLGYAIAHEIGHAFDEKSRKNDENGRAADWWDRQSNEEYERRERCLLEQYSNYQEPGYDHFMNGTRIRWELVADHLGTQIAYRSFQKAKTSDKFHLPEAQSYTNDQLFFYNQALKNCDVANPNYNLRHFTHPTSRYRVNGMIQNMPEFAEAFECTLDSPMNPKHKCPSLF
ncbi:unnamed protein product [Caenorhabditis sp. 36 PRJEB53466]|nr:unnamed protein product [Caenorhabditis sp. 36 PRJEB53466]